MNRTTKLMIIALSWMAPCLGHGRADPIVDVSFDGPYQQVTPSMGDNWTPTWGRDDALYTGCDDGNSFDGRSPPLPAFSYLAAFGKLEGSDPYHLKGSTINGMRDYQQGALFRRIDGYPLGGATYQLGGCHDPAASPEAVCLSGPSGSNSLFATARFQSPYFVEIVNGAAGDVLGASPNDYVFAAALARVVDGANQYLIGRVPRLKLSRANLADWTFLGERGSWVGSPNAATPVSNWAGTNWKITSTYSVDGVLYVFIVGDYLYDVTGDPKGRITFKDASIIKSTDGGLTWTRSSRENHDAPMFLGQRFGAPYFVWYGKDGAAKVDNADKYVYAISNDGYWESGDDYVLGRVMKSRLSDLSARDWSFFVSGDGMKDESWTTEMAKAKPVLSDPGQAGMTGVTYIAGLGRYVMVTWHYPSHGWRDVEKSNDTHTVVEFFEAPRPWGPWTRFKVVNTEGLGWYTPIVGQRFQTKSSPSSVRAFLYTTGMVMNPGGGVDMEHHRTHYRLNYIPITLSTVPIEHNNPEFVGSR